MSARSSVGSSSSRCSSTGTATLYGRLATRAVGGGPGSSRRRRASAVTTVSRSARSGRRSATVTGSRSASRSSISTATTRDAAGSRPRVSDPSPGPTSRTTSSGRTPAVRTIRLMVLASCRKFCPSVFVGRSSSCWASSRMAAGPSRPVRNGPAAGARCALASGGGQRGPSSVEQVGAAAPLAGAGLVVQQLRPVGLLVRGGIDGLSGAAHRAPGAQRELVEALVAARPDGARVVRRLALGQRRPVQAVGGGAVGGLRLGADRRLLGDRRDGHGLVDDLASGLHTVGDGDSVPGDLLAVDARRGHLPLADE